jgi:hypothetical protein
VVEAQGQTTVFADIDGVSVLPAAPDLKVSFSGYTERTLYRLGVQDGETNEVDVVLVPSTVKLKEEITVTAEVEAVASTQAADLLERRRSGAISEGLAGDEMKKNADSDAASAMRRVTGVSVVGGQYVFVRGLGERYSNTTLNGAVLPTTEPDKKVVPLDLFPSGLIENVRITKSYLPDKPAEFAGGLLEIQAISFPRGPTFSVSGSLGYNSLTTFEDGQRYPGGGLDWLGYDDGTRALPGNIPDAKLVEGGVFGGGFTREEMTAFGRSFANVWEPRPQEGRPDSNFSVLAGNSWGKLGAVASLAYNHKNRFRAEQQQYYALGEGNTGVRPTNDFALDYSTYRSTVGAVGNLSYRFSGNHRLALENFYTNSGHDEAGFRTRRTRASTCATPASTGSRRRSGPASSPASTTSPASAARAWTGAPPTRAPRVTSPTCARTSTSSTPRSASSNSRTSRRAASGCSTTSSTRSTRARPTGRPSSTSPGDA